MNRYFKITVLVISIFCLPVSGYSQITKQNVDILKERRNYLSEISVLKLGINELAPISGVLEYKFGADQTESIQLIIYTSRLKKRLFKRDPVFNRFIAKKYYVTFPEVQEEISKILVSCDPSLDASYNADGTYFSLFAKQTYENEESFVCEITLSGNILETQERLGQIIRAILNEIDYKVKEADFKKNLKSGFYYNSGSYYLKI